MSRTPCILRLLRSRVVRAATCSRPDLGSLLIFQALSQLLCLLPWPWWHPSPVASPGLPPPMQSPTSTAQGLSGPLFGAYTIPTFQFQPRRESVDWRRISALDVDRVARELDVAALQENIAGVTFCNLDREVCGRCGQPVDPALLKVLRLAQLSIEYLLHCQDCLSASVAQLEARLQASLGQQERGQQELGRQAGELKGVREESRRRRKMISALQQLLLQTGAHSYHTVSAAAGGDPGRAVRPASGHLCGTAAWPRGSCGHSHWGWEQTLEMPFITREPPGVWLGLQCVCSCVAGVYEFRV